MKTIDVSSLSLKARVGQLIMFGFDAFSLNDHAIHMIKENHLGNVILFTRNIQTPKQVFALNQTLQKLAMDSIGVPLLIAIDQEGGMVTRIHQGATYFPGAMTLAATHQIERAYQCGLWMGEELQALGINMNLAPVLDVNNNPRNPVIGVRSYSDDPLQVAAYGVEMIRGLQNHVIATGKHFPGHGDTHVDSHLSLPQVNVPRDRLETIELVPFQAAIKAGIKAIMSAHISFPALDPSGHPSTLSKAVLTDLLREKLKFTGLIMTDCMQMKAIQNQYTTPKASLQAICAGADLVCISHSETLQNETFEYLLEAAHSGLLPEAVINARVANILKLKAAFANPFAYPDYESVQPVVENTTHRLYAQDTVAKALTLVKGEPLRLHKEALVVAIAPKATTVADDTDGTADIEKQINIHMPSLAVTTLEPNFDAEAITRVKKTAQSASQIIICSYNANIYPAQIELIHALGALGKEVHVIAMRNPYDLLYTEAIQNFVCLFEHTPHSVRALIQYLKGDLIPSGRMPVRHV